MLSNRFTLPVDKISREAADVFTVSFKQKITVNPGCFFMIGLPGIGEKPFSPAFVNDGNWGFTFRRIGNFTRKLAALSAGQLISVRGAFGSSFFMSRGDLLLVGGGCGSPPLHFLAQRLADPANRLFILNGARDRERLLYRKKLNDLAFYYAETSDSEGRTVVDEAAALLRKQNFAYIYAAGPELMLKALHPYLVGRSFAFLMERYMKCGIGICGSCVCATADSGLLICREGPVLRDKQVASLIDFGLKHRDAAGRSIAWGEQKC